MTRASARLDKDAAESLVLTPEQIAGLMEFDGTVNAAGEAEVLSLIVPAVLGPRYGGGLRIRGCSRHQLQALIDLKKAHEQALKRDVDATRARRTTDSSNGNDA